MALLQPTTKAIVDCVERFRSRRPHVHCITNSVAQNFTANVLLAAGATPSMTISPSEIVSFVGMADALLVNLGTMDDEREEAIFLAIDASRAAKKPWSLDPVFVQGSRQRLQLANRLIELNPDLLRCNAHEGQALFGGSFDLTEEGTIDPFSSNCIVQTGKHDIVGLGQTRVTVANGHPLMDSVTAMGCALSALMVGFFAAESDKVLAATSALVLYGAAGEIAGEKSVGPGTFVPHFLDTLSTLYADQLAAKCKLL